MTFAERLRHGRYAFALAVLVALAMILISEISHWHSRAALAELSELETTRIRMQRLLLVVTDAETAQRGYLLTGLTDYIEPYRNAVEALPALLARLRQHYAGRAGLESSMAQLEQRVADKMSELATTMQLTEEGHRDAARELILTNIGKERMDAIRATAEQLLADEARNGELARQKVINTLLVNRVGITAMTLLSLFALYRVLRQSRALEEQRRQQQRAVQVERDQLEVEVRRRTAELSELSHHLLTAREDERKHLARELHDELGALLTTAKLDAARIRTRIGAQLPEASERLDHLNRTLNAVIALKRRITEDLRPSTLGTFGLVASLEILLRDFEKVSDLRIESSLHPVTLAPASELTVYRLVQEALTNLSKYAHASVVQVALAAQDGAVEVTVADDGVGFDMHGPKGTGHGLRGMRFRVEAEGGTLAVQSAPGGGTRIRATLPPSAP